VHGLRWTEGRRDGGALQGAIDCSGDGDGFDGLPEGLEELSVVFKWGLPVIVMKSRPQAVNPRSGSFSTEPGRNLQHGAASESCHRVSRLLTWMPRNARYRGLTNLLRPLPAPKCGGIVSS
jgi:hypothetical protein